MRFINLTRHRLNTEQIIAVKEMGAEGIVEPNNECKALCDCRELFEKEAYEERAAKIAEMLEMKEGDIIHVSGDPNILSALNALASKINGKLMTSRMDKKSTIGDNFKHKFLGFVEIYKF